MSNEPEILFDRRGTAGLVTFNRPQALNSLTHNMLRLLTAQLKSWAQDGAVTRVIVRAAGARAFCAGGDIRVIYELGRAKRFDDMLTFWREEYALNAQIKHYPKPYVALIDGIVMGGGVGLSVHGSHRVAGDAYSFAMPEVGIGFFPDVGATWFLPRMPGEIGTYCALTGVRLNAADGITSGVATHRVSSARFGELTDALCTAVPVDAALAAFAEPARDSTIAPLRAAIDQVFKGDHVEDIVTALDLHAASGQGDAKFAAVTAAAIRKKSPTSLKLALAQVRAGKGLTFDQCMRTEFRIVSRIIHGHDFYEGVRAVIIDKDNKPIWRPGTLWEVTGEDVARHFAPMTEELQLP